MRDRAEVYEVVGVPYLLILQAIDIDSIIVLRPNSILSRPMSKVEPVV